MRFLIAYPAYRGLSLDIESIPDDDDAGLPQLHPGALRRDARRAICASMSTSPSATSDSDSQSHRRQLRRHRAHELRPAPDHQRSGPHRQPALVRRQPAPRAQRSCPRRRSSARSATTATTGRSPFPIPKTGHHPQAAGSRYRRSLRLRRMAARLRRRRRPRPRLRHPQSSLRIHRRGQESAPRGVVSRWRHRCSTRCAPRASSACRPLPCGASAKKTARCGISGTIPAIPNRCRRSGTVQPGHDVDTEGEGDILRVTGLPQPGKRTVEVDTDEPDPRKKLIIDEHMDVYPHTYTVAAVRLPSQ